MSSPKKHKPLSPEELLEWLDKKSNNDGTSFSNPEFDELDEFEREAIEGFNGHSSLEKAKALIDEINVEISKKVQSQEPAKKRGIIWFSAAASLVLVITLSIFLINKTQKETESNIALNDVSANDSGANLSQAEEAAKVQEESIKSEQEEGKEAKPDMIAQGAKQVRAEKLEEENLATPKEAANVDAVTSVAGNNGVALSTTSLNQIDVAKNNSNYTVTGKTDGDVANVTLDTKATSMPVMKDAEAKKKTANEEKAVADEVAAVYSQEMLSKSEVETVANEKADKGYKFKERKVAQKAAVTKAADNAPTSVQNTATATTPSGYIVDGVYKNTRYEGDEAAIKKYVLDYLKNKSIDQNMKGVFKVSGLVSDKGKLLVESVNSVNNECKDCEAVLKKALNEMPDWKPATRDGKAVLGKTSFTLSF